MTKSIKLTHPVTDNGQETKELFMRRSKVKDRLAITKMTCSDEEKEIRLLANLCDISPDLIMELDEGDYQKIQKEYMSFFK
jgi:hypothetical protein